MIHSTNTYLNNVLYRCDICVHDWLNAEQSILELELGLDINEACWATSQVLLFSDPTPKDPP